MDNCIKELLLENKRTLTLNHEKDLKGIHDKVSHVFGPLLRLWGIIEERKEAALQKFSQNNENCSPVLAVSFLFEQSIPLLGQAFNTTSYFRRENFLETLIDDKSKVKEILREQSDCLNDPSSQFLFGEHFENEFSKSVDVKQKPKSLFTGLQKQRAKTNHVTKPMTVNTRPTYNFPSLTYHQ